MDAVPACDPKKEKLIKETRNIFAYLRNKYKYNPHNPIKKIERFFVGDNFYIHLTLNCMIDSKICSANIN